MSCPASAVARFADEIARLSAMIGRRVTIDPHAVLDRSDVLRLESPGLRSANGSCRLVPAADGWIAINLPRDSDRDLLPAWIGCDFDDEPWQAIQAAAADRAWQTLVDDARLLGLPVAGVGEVRAGRSGVVSSALGLPASPGARASVIDLSSLWAGPLCGSILAAMGADVVKIESRGRPDPVRIATPALDARLNGAKRRVSLDFADPADIVALRQQIAACDVVITSARPRAFDQLGLTPAKLFAERPGPTWIAITAYGWSGDGADRIGFGDDAAAAGGLVDWADGVPRFVGDAIADPLTGLAAAAAALEAIAGGGGRLIDAALAHVAADVAR